MNEFYYMQCPKCRGTGMRGGQKFGCNTCVGMGVLKGKGERPKWRFFEVAGTLWAIPVNRVAVEYFRYLSYEYKDIIYVQVVPKLYMHQHAISIELYRQKNQL